MNTCKVIFDGEINEFFFILNNNRSKNPIIVSGYEYKTESSCKNAATRTADRLFMGRNYEYKGPS